MSVQTLPTAPPVTTGRSGKAGSKSFTPGPPRVDLLPPEIEERNREAAARRGMRFIVFVALIVVLIGVAGSWYLATAAQLELAAETNRTQVLVSEQAQYAEVRAVQQSILLGEAAVRVGGATEIDWQDYLTRLQASLPAGVTLVEVLIDSQTALTSYPQSEVPLEGERIATLSFTAISTQLPMIPDWLDRLRELPGFVDATPGSVNLDEGGYTASITMHINEAAYSLRLAGGPVEGTEETTEVEQ